MDKYKIQTPMRFFFMVMSSVMWLGIAFTGFEATSWILYVPAVLLLFAAITSICPGIIFSNWLFRKHIRKDETNDFA